MLDSTPEHPYAAGCIRFTADGPRWHINTAHFARGFNTDIEPEILANGRIRVLMITPYPVYAAISKEDETLVERSITLGISGGVSDCNISVSKAGLGRRLKLNTSEYLEIAGDNSNTWLFVQRHVEGVQA